MRHLRLAILVVVFVLGCDAQVLDDREAQADSFAGGSAASGGASASGIGVGGAGAASGGMDGLGASGSGASGGIFALPTWEEALDSASLPEEDRPARPDKESSPDVTPLGSSGWRGSVEPICTPIHHVTDAQLWADDGGVALAVSRHDLPFSADEWQLWYNSGDGWEYLGLQARKVAGVPGGDLVIESLAGFISVHRDGAPGARLEPAGTFGRLLAGPEGPVVLEDTLSDQGGFVFHHFDGSAWSSGAGAGWAYGGNSYAGGAVWVSPDATYMTSTDAVYRQASTGEFTELSGVPGPATYEGVVVTDDGLIWLADVSGSIYVKSGDSLMRIRDGSINEGESFISFWTDRNDVFYLTDMEFGRAHADGVDVLSRMTTARFLSIAGTSATEVFVAALDGGTMYACDGLFLYHFDGKEFHQF